VIYLQDSGWIRNRMAKAFTWGHIDRFYVVKVHGLLSRVYTVNVALTKYSATASNLTFEDSQGHTHSMLHTRTHTVVGKTGHDLEPRNDIAVMISLRDRIVLGTTLPATDRDRANVVVMLRHGRLHTSGCTAERKQLHWKVMKTRGRWIDLGATKMTPLIRVTISRPNIIPDFARLYDWSGIPELDPRWRPWCNTNLVQSLPYARDLPMLKENLASE
jgi:hypothetical protein